MAQASLASIIPPLASILGEKPTTLIERQRALVRAGILDAQPGRGRGAGVVATPSSIATLLTSMLSSVSLADAPALTKSFVEAVAPKRCGLTGKKTFGEALAVLLTDESLAKRVGVVVVQPGGGTAEILYGLGSRSPQPPAHSPFLAKTTSSSKIRVGLSISGDTVRAIASIVTKLEVDQ